MSAATKARNTQVMGETGKMVSWPVAASTTLYQGTMACLDASGNAIAGVANTTSGTAMLTKLTADNSAGGAAAINIEVTEAIACFANGNSLTKADIGKFAYYIDDSTVTATSTGSSKAGVITQVDSDGVWVKLSLPGVVGV